MVAGIYAINPELALSYFNDLVFIPDYVLLIRHWGIMVGLIGFFIAVAAYVERWREPIILFSFLEKLFMVYLYLSNFYNPETLHLNSKFIPFALTDLTICLYTIGYWIERKVHKVNI
jgi:hypothetical protein